MREVIPCKQIKLQYNLPPDIESLFVENNLRKKYLLVGGGGGGAGYTPHKDTTPYFLSHINKALDTPLGQYENILLFGDFKSTKE